MKTRYILLLLALVLVASAATAQPPGTNYSEQGAKRWVVQGSLDVASGGDLDIESGASLKFAGTALTSSAAELNYLDVTAIGTAQASKALICDANIDISGIRNLGATGTATVGILSVGGGYTGSGLGVAATGNLETNGDVTIDGTLSVAGGYSGTGLSVNAAGNVQAAGTLTVDSTSTLTGAVTATAGITAANDITISASGGNLGAKNEFIGLPRIKFIALGTGRNGTTETTAYMDDTPANEWVAYNANVTVANSAVRARVGTNSLSLDFLVASVDDDGAYIDIANDDLEANESIGFWIYASEALDAGDLDILIDDTAAAPDQSYDVPAVSTNTWTWVEVNITALAAGTGDVVDKIGVVLKDAAGHGAMTIFIDGMMKWDADDEEVLGTAILNDGVIGVMSVVTHENQPNTQAVPAEWTDYFVHYESGSDFIVWMTDYSASSALALVAY